MAIKMSATRINVFLRCKMRYYYNYMKRLPKLENPSFKLGTACHEALEFAGKLWMEKKVDGEDTFSKEEIEEILTEYDRVAIKEGLEDYGLHKEGKVLVKNRLQNFMSGKKLIALEQKFGFYGGQDVYVDNIPLIGAIDKVEEVDDKTLMIIDYKTSKTAPTPDQMKSDMQLSLYDLVANQLWPGYETILLTLDMLKSNVLYTYRTEEERIDFTAYLKEVYNEMLDFKEDEAKASLNQFCPWCDYRNYCDAYKKTCERDNYNFESATEFDNDKLISEWNNTRSMQRILNARESELAMIITEKIKRNSQNLDGGEESIYIRQNSRVTYNASDVAKHLPYEVFSSIANVNKKALENYISDYPELQRKIKQAATTNYSSPFLASKKSKKKGA